MDVVELDRSAGVAAAIVIAGIRDDQLGRPTPCPDWTVSDLLTHLIAGNVKYRLIGGGGEWSRGVPEVAPTDDPAGAYRETLDRMLEPWERPGALDREIDLPLGRGPASAALFVHLGESLVHGWDLAQATSQRLVVDTNVIEACLAAYMSWLPPERPPGVPFGDARPAAPDAPALTRLAAFLGRDVDSWSRDVGPPA